MKKITFLIFLISPVISFAQVDFGSPTASAMGGAVTASAKDWEAIEINPANLGYKDNHPFSMSILNVGLNFQDNGLTVNGLRQAATNLDIGGGGGKKDSMTPAQKNLASNMMTAPGGLNIEAKVTWAAFSFSIKKIGGFAVSLEDELYVHGQTNPTAANVLLDAESSQAYKDSNIYKQLVSQVFNGTSIAAYHYRELNIDYGRKLLTINIHGSGKGGASFENSEYLNDSIKPSNTVSNPLIIYGGFGIKPIWGLMDGEGIVTGGQVIENGTFIYTNPGYLNNLLANSFSANGRGLGTDLGLSISYKKWKFGASTIDLGKITWQNNSFAPSTTTMPYLNGSNQTSGLSHFDGYIVNAFFKNAPNIAPNYTTNLPTQLRLGLTYQLTRGIALSSDYVSPLNTVPENLVNPYFVVGTHINFFKIFSFSAGYGTEKEFGTFVPAGIFLNFLGGFQIFVATDNLLSYLDQNSAHNVSASFGIKLFGF